MQRNMEPGTAKPVPPQPDAKPLFSYRKYWAQRYGKAPFLPMSRAEMDALGWDSCDVILVTGDAYIDHPSFGMAIIGRLLESQGFRVGIIAQPEWRDADAFKALGKPNLFFGVTSGNMDSMVNRYTSDRRLRHNDSYTPDGEGGKRPDRAVIVYAQRCREAFSGVPVVLGGIEASLRRIAPGLPKHRHTCEQQWAKFVCVTQGFVVCQSINKCFSSLGVVYIINVCLDFCVFAFNRLCCSLKTQVGFIFLFELMSLLI